MEFAVALATADLILAEGSMYERLRRREGLAWDEHIAHASLIYDPRGAEVLRATHREYIAVARARGLPMLVGAATWRANQERHARSSFSDRDINGDNVAFVRGLCAAEAADGELDLYVTGSLGPRGDAYAPGESLDMDQAARFHAVQADALAAAGPDLLIAATLPALAEARGVAKALEATGLPYILSFVVRDNGAVLDGTPVGEAFDRIDQERSRPPAGYSINCVHPSVLVRGLAGCSDQVRSRLVGFRGNTADVTPEEIDGSEELVTEAPGPFAEATARVHRSLGTTIVGGCCGTSTEHIDALARVCTEAP